MECTENRGEREPHCIVLVKGDGEEQGARRAGRFQVRCPRRVEPPLIFRVMQFPEPACLASCSGESEDAQEHDNVLTHEPRQDAAGLGPGRIETTALLECPDIC